MQILLKFLVEKKREDKKRFLFWSCILDAEINAEEIKFDYLNHKNIHPVKRIDNFELCIEYSSANSEIIERDYANYKKRPPFFLATDKTFMTGSPYSHSSSSVETYYRAPLKTLVKGNKK